MSGTSEEPRAADVPRGGRRRLFTRRRVLLGGLAGLVGLRLGLPRFWRPGPPRPVSDETRAFVDGCFADVDRSRMWDVHTHVMGVGAGGTGCSINPELRSHLHPFKRLQFELYWGALGVTDEERADQELLERLLTLHRLANPEGKLVLLAFDRHVLPDGTEAPEASTFHTPDEYVLDLARQHADVRACASVHPYRVDAIERLDRAAEGGAVAVKWLPNAMGIDPASPRCDEFYRRMGELGLPLITHGGVEMAVDAAEQQALGNPLRLRRALDAGVRVVVAHCGSLGESADLDTPEGERREAENFDLFLRLMGDRQYEQNLFADISALTFINRSGRPLREMLAATELHGRLVNGSDYPLVAVDPVLSTRVLEWRGYLTADQRRLCNEVYAANPLLFDYVVKRCLAVEHEGRTARFSPGVFETSWLFGDRA